jgi:hypothetical protein
MNSSLDARTSPARPPAEARRPAGDGWVYGAIALLVGATWWITQQGWFQAGDDIGYWLGVAGGTMMLLLLSYPLRKYLRALHRLGKVKWWFIANMLLGVGGPVLILLHSTYRIGSLNAAVAMLSMLLVADSGVIGRFIYLRVHRSLSGEKASLEQLRARAGLDESETRSRLHFAPAVEKRLLDFGEQQLGARPGWPTWLRQVLVLPAHTAWVYLHCTAGLRAPLRHIARQRQWSRADLARRERLARKLVRRYLTSVVRVAQFTAWERLFALWHVLHTPFVYILAISAVVHVIAVHMY